MRDPGQMRISERIQSDVECGVFAAAAEIGCVDQVGFPRSGWIQLDDKGIAQITARKLGSGTPSSVM